MQSCVTFFPAQRTTANRWQWMKNGYMHVSANDCTYPGIENQWNRWQWLKNGYMHVSANDCTYPGIENQWHGNEWNMDTCTWVQMIVHISVFFFSPHVVFPFYKLFRLAKCCWIFDPIAVFPVNCCRYFKSICCLLTVLFASQSWEPESWADMKIRDPQHLTPKMFIILEHWDAQKHTKTMPCNPAT